MIKFAICRFMEQVFSALQSQFLSITKKKPAKNFKLETFKKGINLLKYRYKIFKKDMQSLLLFKCLFAST